MNRITDKTKRVSFENKLKKKKKKPKGKKLF